MYKYNDNIIFENLLNKSAMKTSLNINKVQSLGLAVLSAFAFNFHPVVAVIPTCFLVGRITQLYI